MSPVMKGVKNFAVTSKKRGSAADMIYSLSSLSKDKWGVGESQPKTPLRIRSNGIASTSLALDSLTGL